MNPNEQNTSNGAKKPLFFITLFIVPSAICLLFYAVVIRKPIVNKDTAVFKKLPYFGIVQAPPLPEADSIYHTIGNFSFIDQYNRPLSSKDLDGKIYIADFFFASCQTICPRMATNLILVQKKLEHFKDVKIISHTVDPENDNVKVLSDYAWKVHAEKDRWYFLTGKKEEIYKMAVKDYLIPVEEAVLPNGLPDFVHSEKLILVDKEKRIRGFYDGTSTAEANRLVDEVKVLQMEYSFRKK